MFMGFLLQKWSASNLLAAGRPALLAQPQFQAPGGFWMLDAGCVSGWNYKHFLPGINLMSLLPLLCI